MDCTPAGNDDLAGTPTDRTEHLDLGSFAVSATVDFGTLGLAGIPVFYGSTASNGAATDGRWITSAVPVPEPQSWAPLPGARKRARRAGGVGGGGGVKPIALVIISTPPTATAAMWPRPPPARCAAAASTRGGRAPRPGAWGGDAMATDRRSYLLTQADPLPDLPVERGVQGKGVGPWVPREKHRLLADYIEATHGARGKWPDRVLVDLFSGPGHIQVLSFK